MKWAFEELDDVWPAYAHRIAKARPIFWVLEAAKMSLRPCLIATQTQILRLPSALIKLS